MTREKKVQDDNGKEKMDPLAVIQDDKREAKGCLLVEIKKAPYTGRYKVLFFNAVTAYFFGATGATGAAEPWYTFATGADATGVEVVQLHTRPPTVLVIGSIIDPAVLITAPAS
jgi:hypothetical protein